MIITINLSTVHNYLKSSFSQGEITEEQKKEMLFKFAHIGRALQKYTKQFDRMPSF